MRTQKIEKEFNSVVKSKHLHECVLFVENTNGDFSYKKEFGNKHVDAPIIMASITKLFTTTCILILREQGKLSLDDKVTKYFDGETLGGLHIYKGEEYSSKLTIAHLLCQTSGLPDVSEEGKNNLRKQVIIEDRYINFNEKIALTKRLKPHFSPGAMKRTHYADINFDMLGEIIEKITDLSLEDAFKVMIFDPLALAHTYLPTSKQDYVPEIYYKETIIHRPKYVQSCRASGGAISTACELMIFIKAFYGGSLFAKDIFPQLEAYHKLQISMFPIQYGGGYMRIPLNGLSSFFMDKGDMDKGELVGHSGSSGSFAFYYPEKDLFLVGDVNQIANPALPVRMAMRIAMSV